MTAYLIIFILSYALSVISYNYRNNSKIFFLFAFLTILFPSLLAGFRDPTVGHDLMAYAVPTFNTLCQVQSFDEFLSFLRESELEPLWIVFNFIITRFSDDIFWSFFLQQLILLSLVFSSSFYFVRKLNSPLLFLFFMLTFFCFSMSANRQIFSIAIIFFAMKFLFFQQSKKNIICFFFCILIAYGFHFSSIIAVLLYPLYRYCSAMNKRMQLKTIVMLVIIGCLLYVSFGTLMNFFINNGILNAKYTRYVDSSYNVHKIDLIFWILILILHVSRKKQFIYDNLIIVSCITIIFMILCGSYNDVAIRAAYYFQIITYFAILIRCKFCRESRKLKIIVFCLFFMFFYKAITTKYSEAIPYTSTYLNLRIE